MVSLWTIYDQTVTLFAIKRDASQSDRPRLASRALWTVAISVQNFSKLRRWTIHDGSGDLVELETYFGPFKDESSLLFRYSSLEGRIPFGIKAG